MSSFKADEIRKFCNITDDELKILEQIEDQIKLKVSGKLSIQVKQQLLDSLNEELNTIQYSIGMQLIILNMEHDKNYARYASKFFGLYETKQIHFKLLNDQGSSETDIKITALKYEELFLKIKSLEEFLKRLDRLAWIIKSHIENLRIAHATDY